MIPIDRFGVFPFSDGFYEREILKDLFEDLPEQIPVFVKGLRQGFLQRVLQCIGGNSAVAMTSVSDKENMAAGQPPRE